MDGQEVKQALDELENLILSAGGCAKVARVFPAGADAQLQQIDELLGEMIARVLTVKKHLNISSVLSIVEQEQEEDIAPHYRKLAIEPLTYIEANGLDFCEGNIIKYVSRYRHKDGIVDLQKAQYYLTQLIEREQKKEAK